jgi:hypothetical protein
MARLIDDLRAGDWLSMGDGQDPDWSRRVLAIGDLAARDRPSAIAQVERERENLLSRKRSLQPHLDSAVPILADDVVAYAYSQEHPLFMRDEWDWARDFPVLSPPFPTFFVEWRLPREVVAAWPHGGEFNAILPGREGVLFRGGTRHEAGRCPIPGLVGQDVDYAHWLAFEAFADFTGQRTDLGRIEEGWTGGMLVDARGVVVGEPVFRGRSDRPIVDGPKMLSRMAIAPALLAVTFLHCKSGVRIEDVEPPARLNRARERRGKRPLVRYKTLTICGLKELLRREGGIEGVGLRKALHLVRGHFAKYGPDKPLMGHFVGTVFRSAHMRGRAKEGRVIKDYDVKPPKNG